MYLVNALAFDAKWDEEYKDHQIQTGSFTMENGNRQDVDMMYSEEYTYLEDDMATGFIKYYKDRKYAFVAMLPNEGVTIAQYVEGLTGDHIRDLMNNPQNMKVFAAIPKFEVEYAIEMGEILQKMGMTDAFDWQVSNFSRLGAYNIDGMNLFINRVLHKTYISVTELGTKAGAATVIEMNPGRANPMEVTKEVILNRPFLYMLIDCETNLPFFIGTMVDTQAD